MIKSNEAIEILRSGWLTAKPTTRGEYLVPSFSQEELEQVVEVIKSLENQIEKLTKRSIDKIENLMLYCKSDNKEGNL
jgi:hypothetical protein